MLRWVFALPLVAVACGGSTGTPAPTGAGGADACAGAAIDLDRAVEACATAAADGPAPPAADLELGLADVEVASGQATELRVTVRNRSGRPMPLVFSPVCSFTVEVLDQRGQAADREGDLALAGCMAAVGSSVAITLAPDGVLAKRIPWTARKTRQVCGDVTCSDQPGAPLLPGVYRVEVTTPFSDPVDGSPGLRDARRVAARLVITGPR